MQPAQALNAIRTLTRQLASSRLSGAAAIRAEKPIWDALLGTIDSLLTSNDITNEIQRVGIGVKDVVRHVQSARGWIDYFFRLSASNTMTHDQATKYDAYKSRLLGSIDDTVSSIDREQNRVPSNYRTPWLNRAVAAVALTIAGYTGLAGTLRAEESVAQANKPVVGQHETKDGPKKEEQTIEQLVEAGKSNFEKGDYKAAIESYQKSIDKKPTAEAYLRQGLALYKSGEHDKALDAFKKGKEMNPEFKLNPTNVPEFSDAEVKKAFLDSLKLYVKKDYDGAQRLLESALKQDPKNADLHFQLGVTLHKKEQYDAASNELVRALQLDPLQSRCYAQLGDLESQRNSPRAAIVFYEAFLSINPNTKYRADYLQKIEQNRKKL